MGKQGQNPGKIMQLVSVRDIEVQIRSKYLKIIDL